MSSRSAGAATSRPASGGGSSQTAAPCACAGAATTSWRAPEMAARLRERYRAEVAPALMRELGYQNHMAVPRLEKIVLNMGLGGAVQNHKVIEVEVGVLTAVSVQRGGVADETKADVVFKSAW